MPWFCPIGRPKDDPLFRVSRGLFQKPLCVANAFRRDENPFGVHAGKNVAEAPALIADEIGGGNADIIEVDLRRGVVHHRTDGPDRHARPLRLAHVDQKDGKAIRVLGRLIFRRCPGQKQHQIGVLGAARPDFMAVDDVCIAVAFCK